MLWARVSLCCNAPLRIADLVVFLEPTPGAPFIVRAPPALERLEEIDHLLASCLEITEIVDHERVGRTGAARASRATTAPSRPRAAAPRFPAAR